VQPDEQNQTPEWLQKRQQRDLLRAKVARAKIAIEADRIQDNVNEDADDEDRLHSRLCELEKELLEVTSDEEIRKLVLSRLQLSKVYCQMFKKEELGQGDNSKGISDTHKQVVEQLKNQHDLVKNILDRLHDLSELKKAHNESTVERTELLYKTREQYESVQKSKPGLDQIPRGTAQSHELNKAQMELNNEIEWAHQVNHTFQGLILGIGINWAADEQLLETLVSLGRPMEAILDSHKRVMAEKQAEREARRNAQT